MRDDLRGLITVGAGRNILSLSRLMMLDPRRGESDTRRFIKRLNIQGLTWLLTPVCPSLRIKPTAASLTRSTSQSNAPHQTRVTQTSTRKNFFKKRETTVVLSDSAPAKEGQ